MGWIPITVTLILSLMYFLSLFPFGADLVVIGAIPMISQFVLYKQLLDPLFRKVS